MRESKLFLTLTSNHVTVWLEIMCRVYKIGKQMAIEAITFKFNQPTRKQVSSSHSTAMKTRQERQCRGL